MADLSGTREDIDTAMSVLAAHRTSGFHDPSYRPTVEAALHIGRRYQFDEAHAVAVSSLALQLFDATHALHTLGHDVRLLLEVASLLHDIGGFVAVTGHHKHTLYILQRTPITGLSDAQRAIVANVARYHRGAMPGRRHKAFRALPAVDRGIVLQLAALLRVADALDRGHAMKVQECHLEFRNSAVRMSLRGDGDLSPEEAACSRKSKMFEEVFRVRFTLAK